MRRFLALNMKITFKQLLKNPVHLLTFGFGSGLAPKAPGTFGTLAAIPIYLGVAYFLNITLYIAVTVFVALVGIWICGRTAKDLGVHDYKGIVWDEIAGFLCTMILVPVSWLTVLLGFLLFRLFDIWKPWPICLLDKHIDGGLGIMLDDIAAGLLACACLHMLLRFDFLI